MTGVSIPPILSRENPQLPSLHQFHQHFLWRYVAEVISGVSHTHLWHQALSQVGSVPLPKIVGKFNLTCGWWDEWWWYRELKLKVWMNVIYVVYIFILIHFFNIKDTWTQDTTCTLIHYMFHPNMFLCMYKFRWKKHVLKYTCIPSDPWQTCTLGWFQCCQVSGCHRQPSPWALGVGTNQRWLAWNWTMYD